MKLDENGVVYTGKSGYCLIIGLNDRDQGQIKYDLDGCNSYVITSLDYLLDNAEQVLMFAEELRNKRDDNSEQTIIKEEEE